jgi:hypothetical protein
LSPVFDRVIVRGALLVPVFWLAKVSEAGVAVSTGDGTLTGITVLTLCPASVYVAVTLAVPAETAVTIPLESTVATAAFEEV